MPEHRWKRLFDIALAGGALVAAAPVLGVLAVAIKVDSPGPVLFRHTRVGRGRRLIQTMKLRTMRVAHAGPQITASHDPRITRVGRVLRRAKLDELPQLWNVLRGDMSIVGPRPEVPEYVAIYRQDWAKLLAVAPGLTDAASIIFRDEQRLLSQARDPERAYREIVMPMKLELALRGVERSSLRNDLRVIKDTVLALFGRATGQDVIAEAERRIEELNRTIEES